MKVRVANFNLKGKYDIWWEDLRIVKGIREKELALKIFEKYLWEKYLYNKYYESKIKEFHEHKPRQLTMDSHKKHIFGTTEVCPPHQGWEG